MHSPSMFTEFLSVGTSKLKYSVPGWNQHMGFSIFLESWFDPSTNLTIRAIIAISLLLASLYIAFIDRFKVAISLSLLWFLTLYAYGHDYHLTTLLPILAYLYSEQSGIYRNRVFCLITFLVAAPTTYPILAKLLNRDVAWHTSLAEMLEFSPFLYWIHLGMKPIAILSLGLYIIFKEIKFKYNPLKVED